jgi:hypothetical protein
MAIRQSVIRFRTPALFRRWGGAIAIGRQQVGHHPGPRSDRGYSSSDQCQTNHQVESGATAAPGKYVADAPLSI